MASSAVPDVTLAALVKAAPGSAAASSVGSAGPTGQQVPRAPGSAAPGDDFIMPKPGGSAGKGMGFCYFDCGPARPLGQLTRTSAKGLWMCNPCNNARKALETAARKDPASKKEMDRLKLEDAEGWRSRVRSVRIAEGPGALGVSNAEARRGAIAQSVTSMSQAAGFEDQVATYWLTQKRFICYQLMWEGATREEASALWEASKNNPDISRTGHGDALEVAVSGPPTTIAYRRRELERRVGHARALGSASQLREALEEMGQTGASAGQLLGATFGGMGASFVPGAAVGRPGGISFPSCPLDAPAPEAVVPAAVLESEGQRARRQLQLRASEEEVTPPPAKRTRKKLAVTGPLLELMDEGQQVAANILTTFKKGKANAAAQLRNLFSAEEPLAEEAAAWASAYEANLQRVSELVKGIPTWELPAAQGQLAQLKSLQEELTAGHALLANARTSRMAVLEAKRQAARNLRNERDKERAKLLREYAKDPHAPMGLLQWLSDKGVFSSGSAETNGASSNGSACPTYQASAEDWDRQLPMHFEPSREPLGKRLASFAAQVSGARVSQMVEGMRSELNRTGQRLAIMRIPAMGRPHDELERQEFVPESWAKRGHGLEALRDFGSPWLMVSAPWSSRWGQRYMPLQGIGQLYLVVDGTVTIATWPGSALLNKGSDWAGISEFMLKTMPRSDTMRIAEGHAKYVTVQKGQCMWVPFGWVSCMVTHMERSVVMCQPWINLSLANEYPGHARLGASLTQVTQQRMERKMQPWPAIGQPFIDWLSQWGSQPTASTPGTAALEVIADGHATGPVQSSGSATSPPTPTVMESAEGQPPASQVPTESGQRVEEGDSQLSAGQCHGGQQNEEQSQASQPPQGQQPGDDDFDVNQVASAQELEAALNEVVEEEAAAEAVAEQGQ